MRINNNLMAMNTHRQLGTANTDSAKSIEKLSSGYRINRAGDDAAGLSISEKMRGQIRGLNQASSNAQDGISMIQTAEGALNETHAILQRMRELAVQSSSDTNVAKDREAIQGEMDELAKEITRISNTTEFNTQKLINGGITDTKFHIGANEGQDVDLAISAMDASSLGVAGTAIKETLTGTGSVTKAEAKGTAAAVKDGNSITATIAVVSGTVDAEATAAVKTAAADLGGTVAFETATKIAIGGTEVTLTNVKGLGAGYDAATNKATVVAELQKDIDATALNGQYTVGLDGDKITITSTATGTAAAVDLAGSDAATGADLLGLTSLAVVNGADATSAEDSYTLTLSDATSTASVITGLTKESKSASGTGDFKGIELKLDGELAGGTNTIELKLEKASAAVVAADGSVTTEAKASAGIDVSTQTSASKAITTINEALETVSAERSKLGAMQNRLEHTIKNLDTSAENLQASEARIRDVDMAKEMMEQTKQNILAQASTAMLAQANQAPQAVLQLLR